MSDCASPWFRGLTCDHLYADCPNMRRGEVELRKYGWWDGDEPEGRNPNWPADPHGGDICGLCLHRHNRNEHRARR